LTLNEVNRKININKQLSIIVIIKVVSKILLNGKKRLMVHNINCPTNPPNNVPIFPSNEVPRIEIYTKKITIAN